MLERKIEFVFGFAALINFALPALAQLPPTNMGKFVHQPGDNQYSQATQLERHPVAPPPQMMMRQGRMMLMPAAPATPQVDVSIEPIACDEPIPVAGFPPLPDRLELPVQDGGSWSSKKSKDGKGGDGDVTFHQHYGHVPMSTFAKPKTLPGGQSEDSEEGDDSESGASNSGGNSGGGVGYYKARTAPVITRQGSPMNSNNGGGSGGGSVGYYKAGNAPVMIQQNNGSVGYYRAGNAQPMTQQNTGSVGYYKARSQGGDVYNTNNAGGSGAPQYGGASDKDLRALGKEPKLGPDGKPQIDSADSITINQSTTQDLSLPDDTATYKYSGQSPEKSMGKGAAKNMGKMLKGPLSKFGGMGGMHF